MPGQRVGSFVAAVFGLVYVWVNSAPLTPQVAWPLRALALAVFVAIMVALFTRLKHPAPADEDDPEDDPTVYTRSFWLITAGEVIALFGGLALVDRVWHHPEAGVAWVSVVVGAHFLPLGTLFRQPFFYVLGVAIAACGLTGLVLAVVGAPAAAIATVGGVVPGALLLGFGWWGTRRPAPMPTAVRAS